MVGDFVVRNRSFEQPEHTMAGSKNCSFDGVWVVEDVTVRNRMPEATLPSRILQHLDTPTSLQLQNYNFGQICKASAADVVTLGECCCLQTPHPNSTFDSASKSRPHATPAWWTRELQRLKTGILSGLGVAERKAAAPAWLLKRIVVLQR